MPTTDRRRRRPPRSRRCATPSSWRTTTASPLSPTEPTAPPAASVSLHRFVDLARGQPALAQCFSALSKLLHTPRVVRAADGAAASAPAAASSFETFMPLLFPMCAIRRKPRATPAAAGRKMPGAPPPPNSPLPKWAASTATAIGDALTNGAVDGALAMMKVPLRAIRWAVTLRTRTRWRWRWGSAGLSRPR